MMIWIGIHMELLLKLLLDMIKQLFGRRKRIGFAWNTKRNYITHFDIYIIVKLRQGSGKDGQVMALKAKGLKAETLA